MATRGIKKMNDRKTKKRVGKRAAQLRADIQRANVRLRRLEQAGLSAQNDLYNITVNALGHNRFRVPKNKDDEAQLRVVLSNFLRGKSTVSQARASFEQKRIAFEEFLRETVSGLNSSVIDNLVPWYMDYDIKKLAEKFGSDPVEEMYNEIRDSGITPTESNVERGLKMGLTVVFEYEIQQLPEYKQALALGISLDLDILVDVMYSQGLSGVLAQIEFDSINQRSESDDTLY